VNRLHAFFGITKKPFVVVSTLLEKDKKSVIDFLQALNAPLYLEGVSGIREEPRLNHLKLRNVQRLWEISERHGYLIDGILRIGGMPTLRPWRDLEKKEGQLSVCSLSHLPFSGLSWADVIHVDISNFLRQYTPRTKFTLRNAIAWLSADRDNQKVLRDLIAQFPLAEPSLFFHLSETIPQGSLVYLGNSLPIREWDLVATEDFRHLRVFASRGINGIDGQVSTFLGMALPQLENWGIFGDLTMLYDLAAPWILTQLKDVHINFIVINNGGGQIFSQMFSDPKFQNRHTLSLEHIAHQWGLSYYQGSHLPKKNTSQNRHRLIELIPNEEQTKQFWSAYTLFSNGQLERAGNLNIS